MRLAPGVPVIVLVLAVTAIPAELRFVAVRPIDVGLRASDVVANVAGYVPVGIALAGLGALPAIVTAAVVSMLAETAQLFMTHRFPSPIDTACNIIGAAGGVLLRGRWHMGPLDIVLDRHASWRAATLAVVLLGWGAWDTSRNTTNPRGDTRPGRLEAHWRFDEQRGRIATDASGNGLDGRLMNGATFVAGPHGNAIRLDAVDDYVDFGDPLALRLTGSVTVTAWINASRWPPDDAVIIANRDGRPGGTNRGFQLDTNRDLGARTVGFSVANPSGRRVFRFGTTALAPNAWYHVAGVYDASARTLDVYLNGRPDNGSWTGPVPGCQGPPAQSLRLGRRPGASGFEFIGFIDEVRIYSRALTPAEIGAAMTGTTTADSAPGRAPARATTGGALDRAPGASDFACQRPALVGDVVRPGLAAMVGVLAAIAATAPGRRSVRSVPRMRGIVTSAVAGLLFLSVTFALLLFAGGRVAAPPGHLWMIPVLSLLGGLSVAVSLTAGRRTEHRVPTSPSPV